MRHRILALLTLQLATLMTGLIAASTIPSNVHVRPGLADAHSTMGNIRPVTQGSRQAAAVRTRPVARPVHRSAKPPPARPQVHWHVPSPTGTARPVRRPVPGAPPAVEIRLTPQQRLDAAIARIPDYQSGQVTWVLQADDGHWGTADWYRNVIWISSSVPANRTFDVAMHEWSHLKSVEDYAGNVHAAVAAMNSYFGGGGLVGAERAADCMARVAGATWTAYTDCSNSHWRAGAARLLHGQQL